MNLYSFLYPSAAIERRVKKTQTLESTDQLPEDRPQGRPVLARRPVHSSCVSVSRAPVDRDRESQYRAGRRSPLELLVPTRGQRNQCLERAAVGAGGHATGIVTALAPHRGQPRLIPSFDCLDAGFDRGRAVAQTVSGVCRRRGQQHDRGDGKSREEIPHEGRSEPPVYRSGHRSQGMRHPAALFHHRCRPRDRTRKTWYFGAEQVVEGSKPSELSQRTPDISKALRVPL